MKWLERLRAASGRKRLVGIALVGVCLLVVVCPYLVRYAFRWDFRNRCRSYEQAYHEKLMTCYRQLDWDPESSWFFTMGAADYQGELYALSGDADPDVKYWAARTLVSRYPRSPLAMRMVCEFVDSPRVPADWQLNGAQVLAEWNDSSRIERMREIFKQTTDDPRRYGDGRYWLGLYLASQGVDEGLRYAFNRFAAADRSVRGEIGERLEQCRQSQPETFNRYSGDPDPGVRKGWDAFAAWRNSEMERPAPDPFLDPQAR